MKFSRPLCLLLSLTIIFSFFVVPSRAATNLINPELDMWDNVTDDTTQTGQDLMYIHKEGNSPIYRVQSTYESDNSAGTPRYVSWAIDPTSLIPGDSYTFSMHIPSPTEIRANTKYTHDDEYFANWIGDGFQIGFGGINSEGILVHVDVFIEFTKTNYLSLAGTDYVCKFVCPEYAVANPCIFIYGYTNWSPNVLFLDDSLCLVNDSAAEKEGFWDNLGDLITGFFHDLKWDLIGGSCGDSDCSKTPHTSLSDRIGTALEGLGTRISGFFTTLSTNFDGFISGLGDRIEGFFTKLGNLLLYLTWDEVAPDNPFEGIDSPLDKVTSYFDNVIDYLEQIKTDLTNLVDSVSAGIYVFDEFTARFPWIKALCFFSFALIIITRIVGI